MLISSQVWLDVADQVRSSDQETVVMIKRGRPRS